MRPSSSTALQIRHEPRAQRFVADVDGALALIHYHERAGRVLDFDHTFVPPARRGGGLASQLAAHALGYVRERGYRVIPSCPFVAAFIARHPEHRDLLA
jgi:predicted GNAT family acetyltransferase